MITPTLRLTLRILKVNWILTPFLFFMLITCTTAAFGPTNSKVNYLLPNFLSFIFFAVGIGVAAESFSTAVAAGITRKKYALATAITSLILIVFSWIPILFESILKHPPQPIWVVCGIITNVCAIFAGQLFFIAFMRWRWYAILAVPLTISLPLAHIYTFLHWNTYYFYAVKDSAIWLYRRTQWYPPGQEWVLFTFVATGILLTTAWWIMLRRMPIRG